MSLIEFSEVHKKYSQSGNTVHALKGLNFQIESGQMLALLGPNGAGKSTALEIISGLQKPSSGEVRIHNKSPGCQSVKRILSVTPQDLQFPAFLRVREIIQWVASLHQVPIPEDLIEEFQLSSCLDKMAGPLSGGQRRRLGLCLSFLSRPEIVLLDEPTTGLDVQGKARLWEFLETYVKKGGTLILTTHDLFELSKMSSHRMLMIDQGRVIRDGRVQDLLQMCTYKKISFRSQSEKFQSPWIERSERHGELHLLWSQQGEKLLRDILAQTEDIRDLSIQAGRIEDIFNILEGSGHGS